MSVLNTFGYIDPSVMTYAIQAGAGIAIAVGAFIGLYFRKAKKKVAKKLNVDENKNKEIESDDIEIKPSAKEIAPESPKQAKTSKKSAPKSATKSTTKKAKS